MSEVVVFGSGGMGREVASILLAMPDAGRDWRLAGFVADWAADLDAVQRLGLRFLGTPQEAIVHEGLTPATRFVVAVGGGRARRDIDARLCELGWTPATAIHPSASVGPDVQIGAGSVISAGAHVTTAVSIGRGTIVNVGATVSHDAVLGQFVTLSPHASVLGRARVGDRSTVHSAAVVGPRVVVGEDCVVGAGAVVLEPVDDGDVVVGVPARPIART